MLRFLVGRLHPVVVEAGRHGRAGEPRHEVPVKIDGVELYVGDRVEQRDPPLGAAGPAAWHVAGRQKLGPGRAGGGRRAGPHCRSPAARPPPAPPARPLHGARDSSVFFAPVGGGEHLHRPLGERGQSAFTASSTSSTWPGTFTLCQAFATLPSGPTRTVSTARCPCRSCPYMDFFSLPHAVALADVALLVRQERHAEAVLVAELCRASSTGSFEMPSTSAPAAAKASPCFGEALRLKRGSPRCRPWGRNRPPPAFPSATRASPHRLRRARQCEIRCVLAFVDHGFRPFFDVHSAVVLGSNAREVKTIASNREPRHGFRRERRHAAAAAAPEKKGRVGLWTVLGTLVLPFFSASWCSAACR